MKQSYDLSVDLSPTWQIAAVVLALASIALLAYELRRKRGALRVFVSGAVAVSLLLLAVLRPVGVRSDGKSVGARVLVLVDNSRSMDLDGLDGKTRREVARSAVDAYKKEGARVSEAFFGDGEPTVIGADDKDRRTAVRSDLDAALEAISQSAEEQPASIVVVSDGRLDRPGPEQVGPEIKEALGALDVPIHTVAVASGSRPDASIRNVATAGAAVAHQITQLRVEVGCAGGLACDEVPVRVRELREDGPPRSVASGVARVTDGRAEVELAITLHRAGMRILEISIDAPSGDKLEENDSRYFAVPVARDRVRVLHVAGRPTYDVRALRMWLKSDESVDVLAFFILRTPTDTVEAAQSELALIPFPVDELFTTHLPTFDAVVLQDFNAVTYGLSKHLRELAKYVDGGGGLIMVGGPEAFIPGHYDGSALADVLPVSLDLDDVGRGDPDQTGVDLALFRPQVTAAGRVAPVLEPVRDLIGASFPEMPGTNVVGGARRNATVLLEHPTLLAPSGEPMPVLALGEYGSGRSIALTVDGSHNLLFSRFAADAAGRAHGAFWDALLGWLMRDPRFEPAAVDVDGACVAGEETTLLVRPLPGARGTVTLTVRRLGDGDVAHTTTFEIPDDDAALRRGLAAEVGVLEPGGYAATVEVADPDGAKAPTMRRDFACEAGGDEWADPRPDPDRLAAIAKATGGQYVLAPDAASLPVPEATEVATQRDVTPVLPPWAWTLFACAALGAHWIVRRRAGLS